VKSAETLVIAASFLLLASVPASAGSISFTTGNLVVSVEGNGVVAASSGPYTDNQAAPLTLFQYSPTGTSSASFVNSLVLPQTTSGSNLPVSGEYGSSSEGTLQLSGNGQYLTIMGYGINAAQFNSHPALYSSSGNAALAQSGSLTGQSYTPVARVVATIDQMATSTPPPGSITYSIRTIHAAFIQPPEARFTSRARVPAAMPRGAFSMLLSAVAPPPR
jgi:hypothetical protein